MRHSKTAFLGTALGIAAAASMLLAAAPDTGTTPVQVTVTVSGRDQDAAPHITAANVLVYQNSRRRPVIDWTPVVDSPNGVDLAILIDGSIGRSIALQFPDIRDFVQALPGSTQVGVAYDEYGSARFSQAFTADRSLAAAALRLPEGKIDAGGSVYQGVSDLARHWPSDGRVRVALLVSDGIDVNRGLQETEPTLNPDLEDAIRQAQRAGVTLYAIYAGSAERIEHDQDLTANGQSCLARLTSETGGQAYFEGTHTPVAFKPYLNDLRTRLGRQYVLTFEAEARSDVRDAALRVSTELPHVKIAGPSTVRVPAVR